MKKFSFALACLIGLLFFASCKKDESTNNDLDEEPLAITLITDEGFVIDGDEVDVFHSFKYGFEVHGTDITHFTCTIEAGGETTPEETEIENAYYFLHESTFKPIALGEIKITGTARNAKGETVSATITLNAVGGENSQFIGNYAGQLKGRGTFEAIAQIAEIPEFEYDIQLELLAGENDSEVKASYIIEETTYEVTGICIGDNVVFEPFTINFIQNDISLIFIQNGISMDAEVNLTGTLESNDLIITGTASSEGNYLQPEYQILLPYVSNITFDGVLNKQ